MCSLRTTYGRPRISWAAIIPIVGIVFTFLFLLEAARDHGLIIRTARGLFPCVSTRFGQEE